MKVPNIGDIVFHYGREEKVFKIEDCGMYRKFWTINNRSVLNFFTSKDLCGFGVNDKIVTQTSDPTAKRMYV